MPASSISLNSRPTSLRKSGVDTELLAYEFVVYSPQKLQPTEKAASLLTMHAQLKHLQSNSRTKTMRYVVPVRTVRTVIIEMVCLFSSHSMPIV